YEANAEILNELVKGSWHRCRPLAGTSAGIAGRATHNTLPHNNIRQRANVAVRPDRSENARQIWSQKHPRLHPTISARIARSFPELTAASGGTIHVPFAGRSNPICERLVVLDSDSYLPEQSVSHQVTILLCDGTQAAQLPKAIQHLCSFAGQFGPQKGRL